VLRRRMYAASPGAKSMRMGSGRALRRESGRTLPGGDGCPDLEAGVLPGRGLAQGRGLGMAGAPQGREGARRAS
jgi:hypothetical protein